MIGRIAAFLAVVGSAVPVCSAPAPSTRPAQQPFKYPLPNGFPYIQPGTPAGNAAIAALQQQAHGTLPNQGVAPYMADTSAVYWSYIAFEELFQVAFYSSLLNNITNNVPGFETGPFARQELIDALTVIQGQEEIHALGANAILYGGHRTPIQPCEYIFPTSNLRDALSYAATFTDLYIGTLELAVAAFGRGGDFEFLPLTTSVAGVLGQQSGALRALMGKVPSEMPLLTSSGGPVFSYSAINQQNIYPGSCPTGQTIAVPILPALTILTKNVNDKTTSIDYSYTNATLPDTSGLSLAYINQFNHPISVALKNVQTKGQTVTFSADFPYAANLYNGLTIAAVVQGSGPWNKSTDAANAALFGPGLIEIN